MMGEDTQFAVFARLKDKFLYQWRGEFPVDFADRQIDALITQAMSAGAKLFLETERECPGYWRDDLEPLGYSYTAPKAS